jgi:hypothetical protein
MFGPRPHWDPPLPLLQASVSPPQPGGGGNSSAGEGVGGSKLGRLEKKPSTLSILCDCV